MPDRFLDFEDERAILRLYAKYCHYFAHGEPEHWVEIFTDDGVFEKRNPSHGGLGTSAERIEGHAGLIEMTNGRRSKFNGQVRHQQTDIIIEPGAGADEAVGKSLILVTDWRDGAGRLAALGTCDAEFRRTEDGWRFSRITLSSLPFPPELRG